MTHVVAGFALGLAATAHCAAMCGPLVLLARARGGEPSSIGRRTWIDVGSYHAGRTTTYVLLGLMAGTAGGVLARAGLGRGLAVVAGLLLVAHAVGLAGRLTWPAPMARVLISATVRIGRAARARGLDVPVVHGALHGLLPCGVLYLAATAAAGLGDVTRAAYFMAGFAAGTTPILAVIALAAPAVGGRLPAVVRRAGPVAVALVGLLLVARGVTAPHGGHAPLLPHAPLQADGHAGHAAHSR